MSLKKPYPEWAIPRMLLGYIGRKQVERRPVTLFNMSKRIGFGVSRLLALLEEHKVTYSLIQHEEKYNARTTEVLLDHIPHDLAMDAGINAEKISQIYREIMDEAASEPVDPKQVDPYHGRRLDNRKFEMFSYMLISHEELKAAGKEAGYSKDLILRATGSTPGFKPPSKIWIPLMYRNRKFYYREILEHLHECEKNSLRLNGIKSVRTRKKKRKAKKKAKMNFLSE